MYLRKTWKFIMITAVTLSAGTLSYAQNTPQNVPPAQASAQEAISDASLKKFVKINKDMQAKQVEAQQEMIAILNEQGMDANRFNEIYAAQQQNKLAEAKATDAEMTKFNAASEKINGIQENLGQQVQVAIEKEGIPQQEFQRIAIAYQQDQKLKAKIDGMMQE